MARSMSVDVQTALSMPMGGLSIPADLMDQMANTLRVTLKVDDSDGLAGLGSDPWHTQYTTLYCQLGRSHLPQVEVQL